MNRISSLISRGAFGFFGAALSMVSGQELQPAVSAEVWSYEKPAGTPSQTAFERWRAEVPPVDARELAVDGLSIPPRETFSMVRVAGLLTPPVSGDYAFTIHVPGANPKVRPDESEFWIQDETEGGWKLAQCAGNPNKRGGRTRLEAGVPRRFELWTMGSKPIVVRWEVVDTSVPKTDGKPYPAKLALQPVPASAISARKPSADDPLGDGLRGSWKSRHGLDKTEGIGPNSPWGDPDGDALPNWREQAAGSNPRQADAVGRDGLVRWEIWRDIPGRYVFDLIRAGDYPAGSREVRFLDQLEIPSGNGDRYGSRVRGLIKASADGEHTFHLIADDGAELWLGENETWQSKRLIARADQPGSARLGWTHRDAKGRTMPLRAEQTAIVTLKAGRSYYLEILHKQDSGQDHCAVAWTLPGAEKPELISGRHLVSWKPCPTDVRDDGLPDDWQRATGLVDADPATSHAEADADGDGICNRDEWRSGTDPLNPASLPVKGGMLTSQAWTGIPGRSVSSLTGHERFPGKPDVSTHIDNLDFGREGDRYGVRLRGFLTAPADGSYQFSIAGNNACTLYLSDSEDKFSKRPVSRVEVGTRWRSFAITGPRPAGRVALEKGRRYYIEVIFKRDADGQEREDHSSVAWIPPGEARFAVISPEHFSPYLPDPRDLDDDDLPDDWEKLHALDPSVPGEKHGAWGDPDGDGLENFREFQLGLDPNKTDVHGTRGLALWEMWDNRADIQPAFREEGGFLSDLIRHDQRFPLEPTDREWRDTLESPRRQGNNFGARLRAQVVPPVSGEYRFSIAARDVGELFLSTDASKFKRARIASVRHGTVFQSWDKRPGQMSGPIRLEAGQAYYLEALFARGPFQYDDDFLSIAWKPPGADSFTLITSENLIAFFRDPNDQDDDELPDDWEKRYGLNAADPHRNQGPDGDPDRDGLTNMQEYRQGSDPRNGDTDGDGVTDRDEIHVYGSDPLVNDAVPPKLQNDFVLENVKSPPGTWLVNSDGVMISTALRGTAGFSFTVDRPGLYVVRLDARVIGVNGYAPDIPVSALVDGSEIGNDLVTAAGGSHSWVTGWLAAGTHSLTIRNHNTKFNVGLGITSLKLFRMVDRNGSGEGIPDWYAKIISPANSFALTGVEDMEMRISPACIEGRTRVQGTVNLDVDGKSCEVLPGIGTAWYANVPLSEKNRTVVLGRFEGGAVTKHLNLVWVAVNPFQTDANLTVRVGDAMKFTVPAGNTAETASGFRLTLDGKEIFSGELGTEAVVRFERNGEHIIEVSSSDAGGARTRRITVTAMKADFGPTFSIASEIPRKWKLPGVSPLLTLESAPLLQIDNISSIAPSGLRATALWRKSSAATPIVLARLFPSGPIVAATRLNVFRLVDAAASGDAHVVDILPDGTRVVEISYLIEGVIPDDFSMWIDFAVTDAVFADGSTRYLLTAADFDESGVARIKIYKAPGNGPAFVCHWNRVFEDDQDSETDPETETDESE